MPQSSDDGRAGITRARRRGHLVKFEGRRGVRCAAACAGTANAISRDAREERCVRAEREGDPDIDGARCVSSSLMADFLARPSRERGRDGR